MLVIYEAQQDKNLEFKLYKGATEIKIEKKDMKNLNQDARVGESLGQRLVLGIFENHNKDQDK